MTMVVQASGLPDRSWNRFRAVFFISAYRKTLFFCSGIGGEWQLPINFLMTFSTLQPIPPSGNVFPSKTCDPVEVLLRDLLQFQILRLSAFSGPGSNNKEKNPCGVLLRSQV